MLDEAFQALRQYDWGTDLAPLAPIDEAVAASHEKPKFREDLQTRLLTALGSRISRDAKDYVCRKLAIVGSAAAVPVLAPLLAQDEHSHMARFALERIPSPAAGKALRDALSQVSNGLKIGLLSSIGARRDVAAVPEVGGLVKDHDAAVARAAALALGAIGGSEAVSVLQACAPSAAATNPAVFDALLACAEKLLASNQQSDALAIYKPLAAEGQSRLVRLAGTRGVLACMARQG